MTKEARFKEFFVDVMMRDELDMDKGVEDESDGEEESDGADVDVESPASSRDVSPSINDNARGGSSAYMSRGFRPSSWSLSPRRTASSLTSFATLRKRFKALLTLRDHWIAGLYCFASFLVCGSVPLLGFCVVLPFSNDHTTLFGSSVALTGAALFALGA